MADLAVLQQIQSRVTQKREDIITFLKELCAIPSYDSKIRHVCERAEAEMRKLGFDEVWFDQMSNVVDRIGDGATKLLYDSHLDTVGIGDPDSWDWDPFKGKVENGVFFARGACDEKGSTPGMVYGLALARDLLARGYGVAGCSTSFNDELKALVEVHDGRFLWAGVDMGDTTAIDAFVIDAARHFDGQRLWGVVNNAGMSVEGILSTLPVTDIEKVLQVNLTGAICLARLRAR